MSEGGNRGGLRNFKPRRQREGRNEHQINVPPLRHTTEFRGRLLGKEKGRSASSEDLPDLEQTRRGR